jgi:hypothetical protein
LKTLARSGGAQHLTSQPLDAVLLDGNLNGHPAECPSQPETEVPNGQTNV